MDIKPAKKHKFTSIISTIAIGIAGSFLWEFLFSPLFHYLINLIISTPAKISSFFGKWYVSNISSANREYLTIGLRLWVVAFIALWLLNYDFKKVFATCPIFIRIILVCIIITDLLLDVQVSNTSSAILQNIEIVAPYIDEHEYLLLKSDFYSMQTMDDLETLNESIEKIASINSLHLH